MLTRAELVFTTACVAPDRSMMHFLDDSARLHGVEFRPYGVGKDAAYRGWLDIKVDRFEVAAREFLDEGFTHCFYTDARDSLMLTGADEVLKKYNAMGCPPYVVSTEDQPYPFLGLGDRFPDPGHPWRFIGAGQFLCDLEWALAMWSRLRKLYQFIPYENHDQGWLQLGYVEGYLDRKKFKLDTDCSLFQTASLHRAGPDVPNYVELGRLSIEGRRIRNPVTGTLPCAVHFPGGYCDPETQKDGTLRPVWNALYGGER